MPKFIVLITTFFTLFSASLQQTLGQEEKALPRFVSLKSEKTNVRRGPATRFVIDYIYTQKNLPVEIIREYDIWRQIRDFDGSEGWVNKNLLADNRYALVVKDMALLYDDDDIDSDVVAKVEKGVIGRIIECVGKSTFCRLAFGEYRGYMERTNLWGVYPKETVEK